MRDGKDYRRILQALVGFPTVSSASNLPLIAYAEAFLTDCGYQTQRFYNQARDKANLIARAGPETSGGIMLAGHSDVVPVKGQAWRQDPFTLSEQDQQLIGRGTADMKGFLALAMEAAARLDIRQLKKPLYLVFTYDEEIGCGGAQALLDALRALTSRPRFVLIGEPTDMRWVTAHKGIQHMRMRIQGKAAHSSQPQAGANAILFAGHLMCGIERVLPQDSDPAFDPPRATFNFGMIQGGAAVNIIAEHCELEWEFRHLPAQNPAQIHNDLHQLLARLQQQMHGIQVDNQILAAVPGLESGDNRFVVDELRQWMPDADTEITTAPFVTEGGLYQQAGIPAVICGPGALAQAHQPNESVTIAALARYRDFLLALTHHLTE